MPRFSRTGGSHGDPALAELAVVAAEHRVAPAQHVHDAVDVVEGKEEGNTVVFTPTPRLHQGSDLGLDVGMGGDHAFGFAGGAAGAAALADEPDGIGR